MENQSSMQFLILEQVQFLKVNDDSLLQWELVDVIDAEEGDEEEQEIIDDVDSPVVWSVSSHITDPIEGIRHRLLHLDADVKNHLHRDGEQVDDKDDGDDDGEDDDDDDDDDEYDLDDELVPWDIGNKFGRQRMRKLGKRAFSKMNNSKKNPYLFVRPGCVRGKHGLGLKHSC